MAIFTVFGRFVIMTNRNVSNRIELAYNLKFGSIHYSSELINLLSLIGYEKYEELMGIFKDTFLPNHKIYHDIPVKNRQMAFRSVDGAVVRNFLEPLGQTKVMHSRQREIT